MEQMKKDKAKLIDLYKYQLDTLFTDALNLNKSENKERAEYEHINSLIVLWKENKEFMQKYNVPENKSIFPTERAFETIACIMAEANILLDNNINIVECEHVLSEVLWVAYDYYKKQKHKKNFSIDFSKVVDIDKYVNHNIKKLVNNLIETMPELVVNSHPQPQSTKSKPKGKIKKIDLGEDKTDIIGIDNISSMLRSTRHISGTKVELEKATDMYLQTSNVRMVNNTFNQPLLKKCKLGNITYIDVNVEHINYLLDLKAIPNDFKEYLDTGKAYHTPYGMIILISISYIKDKIPVIKPDVVEDEYGNKKATQTLLTDEIGSSIIVNFCIYRAFAQAIIWGKDLLYNKQPELVIKENEEYIVCDIIAKLLSGIDGVYFNLYVNATRRKGKKSEDKWMEVFGFYTYFIETEAKLVLLELDTTSNCIWL